MEFMFAELYTCCALFLRQCGLWEQLCTLIRLNLQLNLPGSEMEDYKVPVSLPENRIRMSHFSLHFTFVYFIRSETE